MTSSSLIQASLKANIAFCRALACAELADPNVIAVRAKLKDPTLNVVMDIKAQETNIEAKIKAVSDFYQDDDWFWIVGALSTPSTLAQHLLQQGLVLLEDYPSMYFDLQQSLPDFGASGLDIREAGIGDELRDWALCLSESFQTSDKAESFRLLNLQTPHGPGTAFRHYVGYEAAVPVCAGTLFTTAEAAMVHNIATRPPYRKRGLGSRMTLHIMQAAKAMGIQDCFLDAAADGVRMYQMLGFIICARSQLYGKKEK